MVGGTGLYLRALLQGLFEGPSRDEGLRGRLEALAERFGDARLHRLLARVDPEAAARIRPRDRVRVVRALEVYRLTGRPISDRQRGGAEPLQGFRRLVVVLDPDRAALRKAVEARTREMLARGLVDEVRGLLGRGYGAELRPLRAIGYRQAVAVVRGKMAVADAEDAIVTATHAVREAAEDLVPAPAAGRRVVHPRGRGACRGPAVAREDAARRSRGAHPS